MDGENRFVTILLSFLCYLFTACCPSKKLFCLMYTVSFLACVNDFDRLLQWDMIFFIRSCCEKRTLFVSKQISLETSKNLGLSSSVFKCKKEIKSHFFVHLVESNNLVNRSYGFFYAVIVHNVFTIANNCYMFSFFPNLVPAT